MNTTFNAASWARNAGRQHQRGALTLFSAVLILFLMALLLFYASRVSVFETRLASNDVRQKQAFHTAEAAIDQGKMLVLANTTRVLSAQEDVFPDGTGFSNDGWLAAGTMRWGVCGSAEIASSTHPCGGDFPAPAGSYFYDDPATSGSMIDSLPVEQAGFPSGATARLSAVMCFVDITSPTSGCQTAPASIDEESDASIIIWLMGYGYSDCTDVTDVDTCLGRATVAEPISNWRAMQGAPTVPLVTKSTFPPTGTATIVGNPTGGGVGVPLSGWVNDNSACGGSDISSSGSWQTCEYEEWYQANDYPPDVACTEPSGNCMCGPGGNDVDYFLSWKKNGESAADCAGTFLGSDTCVNLDIIVDPEFPCDLFLTYFGVTRDRYQEIKAAAQQILSDCSSLGPQSSGLVWVEGNCEINEGTIVGSPTSPVTLVTEGALTELRGGAIIFGVLYVFDYVQEQAGGTAELRVNGGATIYGALINDGTLGQFQGNFSVVHAGGVLARAAGIAGIGSVNGGWRDFGLPEIAW